MSLINDMLRDLESRKREGGGERELPARIAPADEIPGAGLAWRAYLAGALLILVVIGALVWVYWGQFGRHDYPGNPPMAINPMKPEPSQPKPAEAEFPVAAPQVPVYPSALPQPTPPPPLPEPAAEPEPAPATPLPAPRETPARAVSRRAQSSARVPKSGLTEPYGTPRRVMPLSEASADGLLRQGRQYFDSGQLAQARDVLERALRLDAEAAGARLLLARVYAGQGDVAAALEVLGPRPPTGEAAGWARLRAQLYLKQGSLSQAESVLDSLGEAVSADAELAGLRGTLRQRQGRHGEAVEYFRAALALEPGQARWWLGLAISLEASERFADAVQAYQSVLQLGAESSEVRSYVTGRLAALRADH